MLLTVTDTGDLLTNLQTAVIIGAGPAGLTAALELERRTGIRPVVIEATDAIGGISRTIRYKGNRMDIGGHRFFSKSDRVMQWWLELMPVEAAASGLGLVSYHGQRREVPVGAMAPAQSDLVMLVRPRKSRIYFLRRFFDYPIRLTAAALKKMGVSRTIRCGISYMRAVLLPIPEEKTLEDFLINRFGRQLYLTFFKSYTEKVWGVPCDQISAEWGAQRIKGLSLKGAVTHVLKKALGFSRIRDIRQKETETSLIEEFLYPKLGPGQLWEHVADRVRDAGGEIHLGIQVDCLQVEGDRIVAVEGVDAAGDRVHFAGDYVFSTMPVRDLIRALSAEVPAEVKEVSEGLIYRDFITVGLLARKLTVREDDSTPLKDNWIYIQEPDVQVCRLQVFNNWSPWLVADPNKVWIGLEYFCNETDPLWKLSDDEMAQLAIREVARIGILNPEDVEDDRFSVIRNYVDGFENLFLVGRNGMHKYNNQDHSMLTAMTAVENIVAGVTSKANIWAVNTETDYHEEKNNGENYLELPQRGELRTVLEPAFDLAFYEEQPAGPSEQRAVAVKLLARRKA
jgi:protoporphyrinogen oxidase